MDTPPDSKPNMTTQSVSHSGECNESANCRVLTYDGYRSMQRPRIVVFEDVAYQVKECESLFIATGETASSPVKRGFHVRCEGGRQFRLTLTEGVGWFIESLPGLFATP